MDDYQNILLRLANTLEEISISISEPLGKAANNYRIAAEAICKAVITGHGGQPQGLLEKLIADATKFVEADESKRDAGVFKAEIKYLQVLGNTYSHDGGGSSLAENEDQSRAFDALVKIIRVAFFGEKDMDAPNLPKSIEERIPTRTLGRAKFENPRAEEVVRLCYPKNNVETKIKRSDHTNRLVYDYIVADLGGDLSRGVIFFRSKTAIEKALNDFIDSVGDRLPDSLVIVTPRAYRPDGREIDRQKSIRDVVRQICTRFRGRKIQVSYFDDFVWECCLPGEFRVILSSPNTVSYFVEQKLEREHLDETINNKSEQTSIEYIEEILKNGHDYDPVQVVIGPAGIGKTTFCDRIADYVNSKNKKRVILLSATDFRGISNTTSVNSVSDLYQLAAKSGLIDEANSIENHNFEINLACGNFILIIDGFDELESHLGAALNFDEFMHSLSDLEECFRRVLVILTVRDYDVERFKTIRQTSICRLKGFSATDTDSYLEKRLPVARIGQAKKLLSSFDEGGEIGRRTTIPLYASLICDYLSEEKSGLGDENEDIPDGSKVFAAGKPLDLLVQKIIDREIAKQSLGGIRPDDFFDILIEVVRAPQHYVTKSLLLEYVESCSVGEEIVNVENFLRNPFLRWEDSIIRFKYDSLSDFFKSRLLSHKMTNGHFSPSPAIEFMSEFYSGEGPLYSELRSILPAGIHSRNQGPLSWFKGLIDFAKKEQTSKLPWRKAVSAFLYWALEPGVDKTDRSNRLSQLYGSKEWYGCSIYGKFFALNLDGIRIKDGHIENYSNLPECEYSTGKIVFSTSQINFDERCLPDKLERSIFARDCKFSDNLTNSFLAKKMANDTSREIIRDNIYKIIKVGFRANKFCWKSSNVYKTVTVVGKISLDHYLKFLSEHDVLRIKDMRSGSGVGYIVSDSWYRDARKLVEEKNVTGRMGSLIADLRKVTGT